MERVWDFSTHTKNGRIYLIIIILAFILSRVQTEKEIEYSKKEKSKFQMYASLPIKLNSLSE